MNDLIGQRFGRLTVVRRMNNNKWEQCIWLCECDCGKETIVLNNNLRRGFTKSCGCLRKETTSLVHAKHGHAKNRKRTGTYRSWTGMMQRCTNPNHKNYKHYGDRDITVCERWLGENGYINFLKDMGERPPGYTLERRNNSKGYSPENCCWATLISQNRNRRNNRLRIHNGKTQCIAAWADEYDISPHTLWTRLYRNNWPIEKALTTPTRKYKRKEFK